jgi:uroporphyrinogen decarboxylase
MIMRSEEKALFRAIRGKPVERPPYWLMRQAGRYLPEYREIRGKVAHFLELCFTPELAMEVTLQPIRRFGMDAAILFSDILVVPWGLKQNVAFREGEGPVLDPIRDAAGLAVLSLDGFLDRLKPVYDAVTLIKDELPLQTSFIGFAGAPWTVATYMVEGGSSRGFEKTLAWANGDPAAFQRMIDVLVEATVLHLDAQVRNGVEIVQIFDSWAGVLKDRDFAQWVIAPTVRIVKALREKHPALPIIGFPRGAGSQYLGYAQETGVDVLSMDQDLPLSFARDVLQPVAALQGNLDPVILAAGGPALKNRVEEIVAAFRGGRFVFNLGHGILPHTPPENVTMLGQLLDRAVRG